MFESVRDLEAFSGVARVRFADGSLFIHASGFLHPSYKLPIDGETRFGIASGTKGFAACAALALVDKGGLSLEAPVRELIGARSAWDDPRVTVRSLLTHSSGMPDYFDEETMDDYGALWKERPMYAMEDCGSFLPLFADRPRGASTSLHFKYNNAAFIVLGLVIESVSGSPFQEACEALVFQPAGMVDSGFFRLDELPENCATGFDAREGGGFRTNQYSIPVRGGPDGGAFTTASDMERFWDALFGGRLLKPDTVRLMSSSQIAEDPSDAESDHYGLGLWLGKSSAGFSPYLVGQDPGASFYSRLVPGTGTVYSVLSNTGEGAWPAVRILRESLG